MLRKMRIRRQGISIPVSGENYFAGVCSGPDPRHGPPGLSGSFAGLGEDFVKAAGVPKGSHGHWEVSDLKLNSHDGFPDEAILKPLKICPIRPRGTHCGFRARKGVPTITANYPNKGGATIATNNLATHLLTGKQWEFTLLEEDTEDFLRRMAAETISREDGVRLLEIADEHA